MGTVHLAFTGSAASTGFSAARPPLSALIALDDSMFERSEGSQLVPRHELIRRVAQRVSFAPGEPRFALVTGALPLMQRLLGGSRSLSIKQVLTLRRHLCDAVFAVLERNFASLINPLGITLDPLEFEIDGYFVNPNFMGGGIDFFSTKQLHFDIVEPLGSNLYGPNENLDGGWPVFADAREYCREAGLEIRNIIVKIPGSRNLTLEPYHYAQVLKHYSVAFAVDLDDDMPFSIMVNRVEEAGLLHGATPSVVRAPEHPVRRPLVHYAYDNVSEDATFAWYAALGQSPDRAVGDVSVDKPLIPSAVECAHVPRVVRP